MKKVFSVISLFFLLSILCMLIFIFISLKKVSDKIDVLEEKVLKRTETVIEVSAKELNPKSEVEYIEITKLKDVGLNLYNEKKYLEAYNNFKTLLLFNADDYEIRKMLIQSLYYSNPANTTNYLEIMNEIMKVTKAGYSDKEIEKIEKMIKLERGEIDE